MHSEKEREKLEGLCFISRKLESRLFQVKERKEKKKKEKKGRKKKRTVERETFVFKTVCWFNITGTLKRKKEKSKKELFFKSHNYLFGHHLLKLCYILNAPLYWNLLVMLFIYQVAFFCLLLHVSFSASCRFHLFSLNVLFALKNLQGNFENLTTLKYILL